MPDLISPKPEAESFIPDDIQVRQQELDNALVGAQRRWYQLDLERMSREMTLAQSKEGKLRATKHKQTANKDLEPQIETRLAQILSEQQQLENEIRVYRDAIAKLPKE